MSFSDPLSEEDRKKVFALVESIKALTDQEYYWLRDAVRDLPNVEVCCLRRITDYNCSCNDYRTDY